MAQLKVKDLLGFAQELNKQGMSYKEIMELPIYLGDDDELNGIHCGWGIDIVDSNSKDETDIYLLEMINDNYGNRVNGGLKGKAILIS